MSAQSWAVSTSKYGLETGTPEIKSVGPLTFGPDGILFVSDNLGATIFAIAVVDADEANGQSEINIENLDTRLAAYLGCSKGDVFIRDMAVHPSSADVYLSVMRGSGETALPVLIKVGTDGTLSEVALDGVPFSQTSIEDAPAEDDARVEVRLVQGNREGEMMERGDDRFRISRDTLRTVTVTDMAYVEDVLLVAGASNEEFSSTFRRIPFPFNGNSLTNSLEIFHVSHGKYRPLHRFALSCRTAATTASWQATPARRWSTSPWAISSPGRKSRARRWPSSVGGTRPWAWCPTSATARNIY